MLVGHLCVFLSLLLLLGLQSCSCNTVIALKCCDGIVMASDSFPSAANSKEDERGSSFLQTTTSKSCFALSNNIMLGCACGLKDFHQVFNQISKYVNEQKLLRGSHFQIKSDSVIKYARKLIYGKFPSVHLIVASIDEDPGSSSVDDKIVLTEILPGGTICSSVNYSVGGTGGDLVIATIDDLYRKVQNSNKITVLQGLEIVRTLLSTASFLDQYSGGKYNSVWILSKEQDKDPSISLIE